MGGGKGGSGQVPYANQLSGNIGGYLNKQFTQPPSGNINVPAMGALTNQIGSQLSPLSKPLQVDPNQFKSLQDVGQAQIGQQAKAAQQQLMSQFQQRGLGQSGLAAQAAINQFQRGAAQDMSNLANQLQSQKLGLEFGEQQTARNLAAQNALGLGQLGLGEQAQNLAKQQAGFQQQNYLTPIAAALAQSQMQAAAANKGKGGGKG